MRPWTTRTLNAAVVAAGVAAAGTGSASAAEAATPGLPDLNQVPDTLGTTAPLDTCQTPAGPLLQRTAGSCADVTLKASTPNPVKKVGADIATMARDTAGAARNNRSPLPNVEPGHVLGSVAKVQENVEQLAESRPEVGVKAETTSAGRSNASGKHAKLVEAEIGPRHPGHEGVSAADTAVDLTTAQGQSIQPLVNRAGTVAPRDGRTAPPQVSDGRVDLPRLGEILPAHKHTPALAALDNGLTGVTEQVTEATQRSSATERAGVTGQVGETLASTGTPVGTPSDALPVVGSVPQPLSNPQALGL